MLLEPEEVNMAYTTKYSQSIRRDDTYEEMITDNETTRRRSSSVIYYREKSCIERVRRREPPNGSEIDPDAAPMPPIPALPPIQLPRLSGDGTAERDA